MGSVVLGRSHRRPARRERYRRWIFPIVGALSLLWFLIRVLPKPSRATYPCQRVAFPLASSFVIWLSGILASVLAIRKATDSFRRSRYVLCALLTGAAISAIWIAVTSGDDWPAMADPPVANNPIGVAKGLFPGRVAWVRDPDVTDWDGGTGNGNWWFEHVNGPVARRMVARAVRGYAGVDDIDVAWDTIFRHFNRETGKGDGGFVLGEKITIKLNLVACFAQPGSDRVTDTYDKTTSWKDNIDNPPDLVYGLLDQLVNVVGCAQEDIHIGDPTGLFPNYMYDMLHADFPGVHYWDNRGTLGRTRAEFSNHPFYWSKGGLGTVRQDYVPRAYAEADYVINFAILKSHDMGGITTCGKNHYGSMLRLPTGAYRDANGDWHGVPSNPAYYAWHDDLPSNKQTSSTYRNRVEFMAHDDIGGKTILYLIDGIFAGWNWSAEPEPWTLPPFDTSNGWPCSLFLSMDPVAIDSVALDFLLQQWPEHAGIAGTDDYLIEAALAHDPPSGTFYDPNHPGNVERAASLGVHEHWNDPINKQYSRNLDPENGTGIELLQVQDDRAVIATASTAPVINGAPDGVWQTTMWRFFPNLVDPRGGQKPQPADIEGRWKVLWDAEGLYFLVEVTDDTLVHSPAHDTMYWLDDNVEIFIDADNSKGGGQPMPNYDGANDFEFGFRWADALPRLGHHSVPDTTGIRFAMPAIDGGFRLEAALPWSLLRAEPAGLPPVTPGTMIGLDIHITDNDDLGDQDRDYKLAWHAEVDDSWRDASTMATVFLGEKALLGGTLIPRASTWSFWKGTAEPPGDWEALGFDDRTWAEGDLPIGYGDGPFGTEINDMQDSYATVYLRHHFAVPGGLTITDLAVNADYDDGYMAWINGVEILRVNVPAGDLDHEDFAAGNHESGSYQRFVLPDPAGYLTGGENVLAVQGFNVNLTSSDFKLDLELTYTAEPSVEPVVGFIRGDSNGDGQTDLSDAIHMLMVLFLGTEPDDCEDARDVVDDGSLDIADPVALLMYLFAGGAPPPPPFPLPGPDPTPDSLECSRIR